VERDPDVGVPVDREGLPGLVLQRTHQRARAGDQDDDLRVVSVGAGMAVPNATPRCLNAVRDSGRRPREVAMDALTVLGDAA
jgi:hypothetical protein